MAKQFEFQHDAWLRLMAGVDKRSKAVGVTLGPSGRNVVLGQDFGPPQVCSDGVTIAKEIELREPFENMGAQLVKEVSAKTSDVAGDGTTTAIVLAEASYTEGMKNVSAGANPRLRKRGSDGGGGALGEAVPGGLLRLNNPTTWFLVMPKSPPIDRMDSPAKARATTPSIQGWQ